MKGVENFYKYFTQGRPDECWEWQGAINNTGYGNVWIDGKNRVAHRVAYFLKFGGISLEAPKDRTAHGFVLHRCDNRPCVNWHHLFLGTQQDNLIDCYAKKRRRQPKGQSHSNAKLSDAQACAIRRQYAKGSVRQVDLAKKYSVSQRVISLVVRGRAYP